MPATPPSAAPAPGPRPRAAGRAARLAAFLGFAQPAPYGRLTALAYALAVGLRLWRYLSGTLSNENALIGIMAQDVLAGKFPLFFYGQDYMGALEAYLSAPLLALFGPTHYVLALWPPLASLATLVAVHRLLRRLLPPAGALAGLAVLAVPGATFLFWAGYAQTHIALGLLFSALVMLQTARLWESPAWGGGPALIWGLLAGLGLYCFPQALTAILPCALFLATFGWRRLRPRPVVLALAGGLLGSWPILFYNLTHGWPSLGQAGAFDLAHAGERLAALFANALPIALGCNTPAVGGGTVPGAPGFWAYLALLAAALGGGLVLARQGCRPERRLAWLPLMVALGNLGVLPVTSYGRMLAGDHQAYLLPFMLTLAMTWGAAAARLAAWRNWAALVLVGAVLAVQAGHYPGFTLPQSRFLSLAPEQPAGDRHYRRQAAALAAGGFHCVYREPSYLWNFFAAGDPLFSEPWEERAPHFSFRVDAAEDPAWWAKVEPSLKALGLAYRKTRVGEAELFHGVAAPPAAQRLLPSAGWRARDLAGADLGTALHDGDLSTGFATPGPARDGQGFVLDLGRVADLGGMALVPAGFKEIPAGFLVELAGEDQVFRPAGGGPDYWGPLYLSGPHPFLKARHARVECYFPAQAARYLRVRHLGSGRHPLSVREVLAFGPGPEPAAGWAESGGRLLALLAADPPAKLFADAWPAALVRSRLGDHPWTLPGNRYLDVFGTSTPELDQPVWVRGAAGEAVVATWREAAAVARALAGLGARFTSEEAGRLVLFRLEGLARGERLWPVGVASPVDSASAAALARGLPPAGRWASQGPQWPGVGLVVDLGASREVAWVELKNPHHPDDFPRGLAVEVSDDGRTWRPAAARLAGPLHHAGPLLLAWPGAESLHHLDPPVSARYLRLSPARGHPVWWWSVEELLLFAPPPG